MPTDEKANDGQLPTALSVHRSEVEITFEGELEVKLQFAL